MKRIAMIYREIGTCGGIQRGASFQVGQFREWGYEPIVLTEMDLGNDGGRQARLEAVLREQMAEIVIEHDAYKEEKLAADIEAARSCGVPIVVFWHSVFSWMFALSLERSCRIWNLLDRADALIALSPTDETFFRLRGNRALAIPYCDVDIMAGFNRTVHPHRLIWLGRLVDLKRPLDALRILELVREDVPDAELDILGAGNGREEAKLEEYLASRPDLRAAVHLHGFQKDVRPFLEAAGIGLVTSRVEGFCHSIVEMKMASIPVVSYSMPYLETLAENSGAFQIPQGDVAAAAKCIVRLFQDETACAREGQQARVSYECLRAFDQRRAYERLFADIPLPRESSDLCKPQMRFASRVVSVLAEHALMGFETRTHQKECQRPRGIIRKVTSFILRKIRCLCNGIICW